MSRRKLPWLVLLILVVLWWHSCPPKARDSVDFVGLPWLERMPKDPRDAIAHLLLIPSDEPRFGAVGRSSAFRIQFDLLAWKQAGDRLEIHLLQDDEQRVLRARAWECAEEKPRGFDLCLELIGERGEVSRYFSRSEWRDRERLVKDTGLRIESISPAR